MAQQPSVISGQNIIVPAPQPGDNITVTSSPSGNLTFEFDVNAADPRRVDNDLVLTTPEGSVTIEDFFAVGDESLPTLTLTDGIVVDATDFFDGSGVDMTTAAGPTGARADGSGTSYDDGAGALLDGVDRLGSLGTFHWNREVEFGGEDMGVEPAAVLTLGTDSGNGLSLSDNIINESEAGFKLTLTLDKPASGTITVSINITGTANLLNNGHEAFNSDVTLPTGTGYSYDAATGILTVTIPAGSSQVIIPFGLIDDHISFEGNETLSFTVVGVTGPVVVTGGGTATITITDDTTLADGDPSTSIHELDGPIIGVENTTDPDAKIYEGSTNTAFTFKINLQDPHNPGQPYGGFAGSSELSQDLTITLNVGGSAVNGSTSPETDVDYHLMPGALLQDLIDNGVVEVAQNSDNSLVVDTDGNITIKLSGKVDANGNLNSTTPFDLSHMDSLLIEAHVHINGGSGDTEGEETITLSVDSTSGNESMPASGAAGKAEAIIEEDPRLTLSVGVASIQESATAADPSVGIPLVLEFDKDIAATVTATITINFDGTATIWDGDPATKYAADIFLPGQTEGQTDGKAIVTLTINGEDVTLTFDPATNTLTLEGNAGAFGSGGTGGSSISFTLPVNDDHLSEDAESISFTLSDVTLDDGAYKGTVALDATEQRVDIIEDTIDGNRDGTTDLDEKDGPIIGITVNDSQEASVAENGSTSLEYQITLKNPYNPTENYPGYEADGVLSQNMTLTLKVDGTATASADYTLDFSSLEALRAVGMLTYNGPDSEGTIIITLYGKFDATDNPAGTTPFAVAEIPNLKITANILDDAITERTGETIIISVSGDGSNESQGEGTATGTIEADEEASFSGPVIALQEKTSINESAETDGTYAQAHNTVTHTITLTDRNDPTQPQATDEPIRMTISLKGNSGASVLGADVDGAGADFVFGDIDGKGHIVVQFDDGFERILTEGQDYTYNSTTGICELTIPAGVTEIRFDVTAVDDLRETGDVANEGYTVELGLLYTDANGNPNGHPDYDPTTALPDAEASLDPTNTSHTTIINPDTRPAAGTAHHLNPDNFDGPWVSIALTGGEGMDTDTGKVAESSSDDGNTAEFTISLLNPNGDGSLFTETEEIVSVSLKISGGEGFTLSDLIAPAPNGKCTGTIIVTFSDRSWQEISITGYAWDTEINLTGISIPKGASTATFGVPINDDPLGADATSNHDKPEESFKLEIVDVKGNEARVKNDTTPDDDKHTGSNSAGAIIVDDKAAVDNPDTPINEARDPDDNLEGIGLNLVWKNPDTDNAPDKVIDEGSWPAFKLNIIKPGGNDPYAGYSNTAGLPDDLVVNMKVGGGALDGKDFGISFEGSNDSTNTALYNALKAGDVKITYVNEQDQTETLILTGPNANYHGGDWIHNAKGGQFTVTIKAGTTLAKIDTYDFIVKTYGDNISEWDKDNLYKEISDESLSITIESVQGNESYVAGNGTTGNPELAGDITDMPNGLILLEGGDFHKADVDDDGVVQNPAGWKFSVDVKYVEFEKDDSGTLKEDDDGNYIPKYQDRLDTNGEPVLDANGQPVQDLVLSNDEPGKWDDVAKQDPGEAIHFQLKFTDTETMQHDQEHCVTAYDLFLSMNGLADGSVSQELFTQLSSLTPGQLLALANGQTEGLPTGTDWTQFAGKVLVGGDNSWSGDFGSMSASFDIYAPAGVFAGDATLDFTIAQGDHISTSNPFKIVIVEPEDGYRGEIIQADTSQVEVKLEDITIGLAGGKTIYEDPNLGTNHDTYTVTFESPQQGEDDAKELKAGGNITFKLNIKNGSATFDSNTTDNHLDSLVEDYAFADAEGKPLVYTDASSLTEALQSYLDAKYPGVQIIGEVKIANGVEMKLDVPEGFDLTNGIKFHFTAQDDSWSDSGETFSVQLSDVGSYVTDDAGDKIDTVDDPLNLVITPGTNMGTTTILDETSGKKESEYNGFALALGEGKGYEIAPHNGGVLMPVHAFSLVDNPTPDNPAEEGASIRKLADFITLYEDHTGTTYDQAEEAALKGFIKAYFAPQQEISFGIDFPNGETDSSKYAEDYKSLSSASIPSGDWEVVIDGDNVYFEATFTVETINDYLSEGDEFFTVAIKPGSVTGSESRPLTPEEADQLGETTVNKGHIVDVHDGPAVLSFGPEGKVYEPIDFEHGPVDGKQHEADPKVTQYSIVLDKVVSEDTYVWLTPDDVAGGNATYGEDYIFGTGMYWCDANSNVYKLDADGNPQSDPIAMDLPGYVKVPSEGGYFTIIEKGNSSAKFEVKVIDDNDDKTLAVREDDFDKNGDKLEDVDLGMENISIAITDINGSEVTKLHGDGNRIPYDESACYQYTHNGVTYIIDPVNETYTSFNTKGKPTTVSGDYPPSWLVTTSTDFSSTDEIHDDMRGPVIKFDTNYRTQGWPLNSVDILFEDYTTEPVEVTFGFYNEHGVRVGEDTVRVPVGETIFKIFFDKVYELGLENQNFFMKMENTKGGETVSSNQVVYVYYDEPGDVFINVDKFTATDIYEGVLPEQISTDFGKPATVSYELEAYINPHALQNGDTANFNLKFLDGSASNDDFADGTYDGLAIEIGNDDMQRIKNLVSAEGAKGFFNISQNALGEIVITFAYEDANGVLQPSQVLSGTGTGAFATDKNGEILTDDNGHKIPGKLPTAIGDAKVEGTENFTTILTSPQGNIDLDAGFAETNVIDQTRFGLVFLDKDGNLLNKATFSEGSEPQEITAKLVVTDANGDPIDKDGNIISSGGKDSLIEVHTNHRLEFDLNYGDSVEGEKATATYNADYSGPGKIVIESGASEVDFKIALTDDYLSEDDENFFIQGKLSDESEKLLKKDGVDFGDGVNPGNFTGVAEAEIIIEDYLNGPEIRWVASSTVREDGTLGINLESYKDNTRTVVDEDVKSIFELKPAAANPISLEDIEGISVDGVTYTFVYNNATDPGTWEVKAWDSDNKELSGKTGVELKGTGDDWSLTITSTMTGGQALDSFAIKFHNDVLTEGDEKFTLQLVSTKGGETSIQDGAAKEITVKDVLDGPTVNIEGGTGSEDDNGTTFLNIVLSGGSKPTEEESAITLQLSPEGMALLETGSINDITAANGATIKSYDPDTGVFVVILPAGAGGTDKTKFEITFDVKDDSVAGGNAFAVSLTDVQGGEMSRVGVPDYSSQWWGEQSGSGDADDGRNTFKVSTGAEINNIVGEMQITVGGIADTSIVKECIISTDEAGLNRLNVTVDISTGKPVLTVPEGSLEKDYYVTVVYEDGTDPAKLSDTKTNITITEAKVAGFIPGATVVIEDEHNPDQFDGPTANLSMDSSVVEGESVNGKVTLEMGSRPGDSAQTIEGLHVTLELSTNPDGSYPGFNLSQELVDAGYTASQDNGSVTITIPEGTPIPAGDAIDIAFSLDIPDNSLIENPDLVVTLTSFTGTEDGRDYEVLNLSNAEATVTIEDSTTDTGPKFTIANRIPTTEGNSFDFDIHSPMSDWKDVPSGTKVNGSIELGGLKEGDTIVLSTLRLQGDTKTSITVGEPGYALDDNGNLVLDVVMTKPTSSTSNRNMGYLRVTPADDALAGERNITIAVTGEDTFETFTPGTATATVKDETDGDGFTLGLAVDDSATDKLTYAVTLQPEGNYFNTTNTLLPTAVTFTLMLEGMAEGHLTAIAEDLNALDNVEANLRNAGEISITLQEGYVWNTNDGKLEFTVNIDHTIPVYTVKIEGATSGLEVLKVTPEATQGLATDITTGAGNDLITITGGGVAVSAGLGNDDIIIQSDSTSSGGSHFDGGEGLDSIDYSGLNLEGSGIFADLASGRIALDGSATPVWEDTIENIEVFTATDNNDIIHAGGNVTTIYGGKGDDTMYGSDEAETFAWKADDIGDGAATSYTDTIEGFTVGKDALQFEGIFEGDLNNLINNARQTLGMDGPSAGNTVTLTDETGKTLNVECSVEDKTCTLTLENEEGSTTQKIELSQVDFGDFQQDDMTQLIQTLIKIESGN